MHTIYLQTLFGFRIINVRGKVRFALKYKLFGVSGGAAMGKQTSFSQCQHFGMVYCTCQVVRVESH